MADLDELRRSISYLESEIQDKERKMQLCLDRKNALDELVTKIRQVENEYPDSVLEKCETARNSLYEVTNTAYYNLCDNYEKMYQDVQKICRSDSFQICIGMAQSDYQNAQNDYQRYEGEKISLEGQLKSAKERYAAAQQEEERKRQCQSLMTN